MPGSTQHAVFPNSPVSLKILILLIPSTLLSAIAFFVSKPIGSTSMFLVPSAFLITSIHHAAIRILLARKPRATADADSATEVRLRCLYHLVNICTEGLIAALWLAGGLISILVNVLKWRASSPQDVAAAGVAILEAGLMFAVTVYSWKLRKEAQVYQMLKMTQSVSAVDVESVGLMDRAK